MPRLNLPQKSSSQARSKARPPDQSVGRVPSLSRLPTRRACRVDLLQLRIQPAAGDAELGARLHDAQAGGAHARVQPLRLGHQLVEHRVVELAPPVVVARLAPGAALRRPACATRRRTSPAARAPAGALKSGPRVVQAPSNIATAGAAMRTSPTRACHRADSVGRGRAAVARRQFRRPGWPPPSP